MTPKIDFGQKVKKCQIRPFCRPFEREIGPQMTKSSLFCQNVSFLDPFLDPKDGFLQSKFAIFDAFLV
jgi:hypothetical protein